MIPPPRASVRRPPGKPIVPPPTPGGKSSALIPAVRLDPFGAVHAATRDAKTGDPGLPARWLRQAVMLSSLTASGVVCAAALYAGCSLLAAVVRGSVAMTSVAGLGWLLAHVLMAQIADAPVAAEHETRSTT